MKPPISYEEFAKLDLRVATITAAREHPNADKLLLLRIDVDGAGAGAERQIVAGIRGHYDPAALVGTQVIVLNNLEEALIRGEESSGMLLAAGDGDAVVLLRPDRPCTPGARVK
ncbi:MAG TPA: methionine--tRNA ligase subunit beta [Planctomycetaceae bacterium]|nr:methionine--tRNA ligase subunit beta [Planctomycetaceae bacterium]